MPATKALTAPGPLIERFPIRLRDGTTLYGSTHKTHRRGGCRLQVRDLENKLLYDTDDCFHLADCTNRLDHWLADTYPA